MLLQMSRSRISNRDKGDAAAAPALSSPVSLSVYLGILGGDNGKKCTGNLGVVHFFLTVCVPLPRDLIRSNNMHCAILV